MRAYDVLEDALFAYNLLEEETDSRKFRLYWVACVTLLRAVGHVLDKVDACNTTQKSAIGSWWKNIKLEKDSAKNKIFWEFINKERNFAIKEYSFNFTENPTLGVVEQSGIVELFQLEDLYIPISLGESEGEDYRDIVVNAIQWWIEQLQQINESDELPLNISDFSNKHYE